MNHKKHKQLRRPRFGCTCDIGALGIVALLAVSSCSLFRPSTVSRSDFVFGTPCTITLFKRNTAQVLDLVFDEMRRVDSMMSAHDPGSVVSEINADAGVDSMSVPDELYKVLQFGVAFGQISGGAFDISIGPLVRLWDIGGAEPRVPEPEEIDDALGLVNYRDVLLLDYENRVLLRKRGMHLDLGGIAKGYAADRAVELLDKSNIDRALIDFGGNIVAFGEKENGEAWRIGIQHPVEPRGNYLGLLLVKNSSVVTSGDYERYFEVEDRRYHHILDTETGYPVDNGVVSVTIVADNSLTADALSTTVFALGIDEGLTLVENFDGVEAVVVTDSKVIHMTRGAASVFLLSDKSYEVSVR